MKLEFPQNNKGFTLVETLVAISILSLSILATFTSVQNGLQNSSVAKDQTVAFYLAQEAMDFIKNIRDENALHSISEQPNPTTSWLKNISAVPNDPCYFGKTCVIDSPNKTIAACSGGFGTCDYVTEQTGTNLFGQATISGWTPTIFRREIQIANVVSSQEIQVTVRISWSSRGTAKSFQVTESIFNRQ